VGDFMEQELRFGLDLGQLALHTEKKIGSIMSNFLGRFFQVFMGKKNLKIKNIVVFFKRLKKYCFFKHFIS
jgi:hypothetical protein